MRNQVYGAQVTLTPGDSKTVIATGTHIRIKSSSSESAILAHVIGFDNNPSPAWPMTGGESTPIGILQNGHFILTPFKKVVFSNPSSTETITFSFRIAIGEYKDSGAEIRGSVQINPAGPTIETPVAVSVLHTAVSTLAANVQIKERILTNVGANTVWVGDSNVGVNRGTPIFPNGSVILNVWGAVSMTGETGPSTIAVNNILKT